jgi:hypothetical protein
MHHALEFDMHTLLLGEGTLSFTPWPLKPPVRRPLNIYSTNVRTEYFKHAA